MKKIVSISMVLFTLVAAQPSFALLLDSTDATVVDAMVQINADYVDAMLQLSEDIGTMADRIVTTEELILQMSDRIVQTEAMMAQLTVIMAQIAAGETVDPAVAAQLISVIEATQTTAE